MLLIFTFLILQVFACNVLTAPSASDQLVDPVVVNDVAFIKLGTYRGHTDGGAEYQKSFFLSRYSSSLWAESQAVCSAYGLELASMETLEEARAFLCMGDNESYLRQQNSTWLWIDGITLTERSTTDWYWTKSGRKFSFPIDWASGNPSGNGQFCLAVGKATINAKFAFNDGNCSSSMKFVCQRIEFFLVLNRNVVHYLYGN